MKKGRPEVKQEKTQTTSTEFAKNGDGINTCTNNQDERNNKYYIMTKEEADALVSGDIKTVEHWVCNLDRNRATWLLHLLINKRE